MDNTYVDPIKNKTCVKYLYKPNLANLGENYYGATKRIHALHNKISNKPEITAEMDKYIQQQIDNDNYMEINPEDQRKHHQLQLCCIQLCCLKYQHLYQSENDHGQFHAF